MFKSKILFVKMAGFRCVFPVKFKKHLMFIASSLWGIAGKEKSKPNTAEEVVHNVVMATIALKDGNIEKSGNLLLKTLNFAQSNNFPVGVISACDLLSSLAIKVGDYKSAENLLLKAQDNLLSQGTPEDDNYLLRFNLKLSRIYSSSGNDNMAENGFKSCLKIQKKKLQNNADEETFLLWTTTLYWYGKFLIGKNRFQEAKSYLTDCYLSSLKIENLLPNQIMVILYNLGEVCEILGEHDEAADHLLKGVNLDKSCKNPDITYFYTKLGMLSLGKGLYQEAKLWCDQAQKFAVKYKNPVAEKESNECLEKLNAVLFS